MGSKTVKTALIVGAIATGFAALVQSVQQVLQLVLVKV